MKKKLEKYIIKILHTANCLEFKAWKSQTHFEQYTAIYLFGKELQRISWSGIELMNIPIKRKQKINTRYCDDPACGGHGSFE